MVFDEGPQVGYIFVISGVQHHLSQYSLINAPSLEIKALRVVNESSQTV